MCRRPIVTATAIALILAIWVHPNWLAVAQISRLLPLQPQQDSALELAFETPYTGVLKARSQKLRFSVEGDQYFAIELAKSTTRYKVVLSTPDGRIRGTSGCSYKQPLRIAEVSQVRTSYIIDLLPCSLAVGEPDFQVIVSRPHAATLRDRSHVNAARFEREGDALVHEYRAINNGPALRKYEQALQAWRVAGDRMAETRTLLKLAALSRETAQISKAVAFVERASSISRELDDARTVGESLLATCTLKLRTGDLVSAMDHCSRANEAFRTTGNPGGQAEAVFGIGDVHYDRGDSVNATEAYTQAYTIWNELGYRPGRAMSLLSLATIRSNRSELEEAKTDANEAFVIFKEEDDRKWQVRAAIIIGNICTRMGRKQEALDYYQQAQPIVRDSGDFLAEALLAGSMARTYSDLGDDGTALQYSQLALDRYRKLNHRVGEANALRALGGYYFRVGDTANALRNLEDAIQAAQRLGNKRLEAVALRDLGPVFESAGDTAKAIDSLNQALEINRSVPDARLESSTRVGLGRIHETRGESDLAIQEYDRALQLSLKNQDRFGELAARYGMASSLRSSGRLGDALQESKTALEEIETLRASVAGAGLRTSYFASVKQQYDLQLDLFMKLGASGNDPAVFSQAFEASERSHARSLLDSIAEARNSISAGIDQGLLDREVSLRTSLDTKSERYTQLLSTNGDSKEATVLDSEIRRLNAEYDELLGQLRSHSPRYAELVRPQPLNLTEIQKQVLDGDTLLLEYALGDETSYLWAVTHDDFTSYVLPKRSDIEKSVRQVRELMTARAALPGEKPADFQVRLKKAEAEYPMAAAELSRMLLGPVADRLGTRRLVIVAEGALQYLAFSALPAPQSSAPLISEHEIVNLPSASTLAVIRREAPLRGTPDRTLAVFADPVFDAADSRVRRTTVRPAATSSNAGRTTPRATPALNITQVLRSGDGVGTKIDLPRLTATRQEAEAILAMVPEQSRMAAMGFSATKVAAMNPELKRYRVVHFATHTILNDDHPDLSSLVLSLVDEKGSPQSGFLRLRDMYNLQLAAELVVLSACDTGLGKEVKGEGLMSMVRGFMYSGTPRVLASLWKVDDEATAELMTEFYKNLLQDKLTPAAALRQAQITQMQKKSRQSPYYWAGFQLQGEWN